MKCDSPVTKVVVIELINQFITSTTSLPAIIIDDEPIAVMLCGKKITKHCTM
jgi:hypothetical protein